MRSLDVLAEHGKMKSAELAELVGSTRGFVPQVLSPLVRAGWLTSEPGPGGGYVLLADLRDISLLALIEAIEGPTNSGRCVFSGRPCEEADPCALHEPWSDARNLLLAELQNTTVAEATRLANPGGGT